MSKKFKSLRARLFFTLCIVVFVIIMFFIIVNNIVLSTFFYYSKVNDIKNVYQQINQLDINKDNEKVLEEIC